MIAESPAIKIYKLSLFILFQSVNLDAMEIDVTSPAAPPVEETTLVTEIVELVARAVILVMKGRLAKSVRKHFVLISVKNLKI